MKGMFFTSYAGRVFDTADESDYLSELTIHYNHMTKAIISVGGHFM